MLPCRRQRARLVNHGFDSRRLDPSGIESAENADHTEDAGEALKFLQRVLYCFDQGRDEELSRKARTHRRSLRF